MTKNNNNAWKGDKKIETWHHSDVADILRIFKHYIDGEEWAWDYLNRVNYKVYSIKFSWKAQSNVVGLLVIVQENCSKVSIKPFVFSKANNSNRVRL